MEAGLERQKDKGDCAKSIVLKFYRVVCESGVCESGVCERVVGGKLGVEDLACERVSGRVVCERFGV